jgi:hypothetical protein
MKRSKQNLPAGSPERKKRCLKDNEEVYILYFLYLMRLPFLVTLNVGPAFCSIAAHILPSRDYAHQRLHVLRLCEGDAHPGATAGAPGAINEISRFLCQLKNCPLTIA